jgi:hypothetical protein
MVAKTRSQTRRDAFQRTRACTTTTADSNGARAAPAAPAALAAPVDSIAYLVLYRALILLYGSAYVFMLYAFGVRVFSFVYFVTRQHTATSSSPRIERAIWYASYTMAFVFLCEFMYDNREALLSLDYIVR